MSQAVTSIQGRQTPAAAAFWEYLVAYKLVVDVIPRHKDYLDRVETTRGQLHRDFNNVLKVRLVPTHHAFAGRADQSRKWEQMRTGLPISRISSPTTTSEMAPSIRLHSPRRAPVRYA